MMTSSSLYFDFVENKIFVRSFAMAYDPNDTDFWLGIGSCITKSKRERDFASHFGGPSIAIAHLWKFILSSGPLPHLWGAIELLQSLCFLKLSGTSWATICSRFDLDEKTMKKNLQSSLEMIDRALPEVVFLYFIKLNSILTKFSV
jgi:hypothetical protein